MLKIDLRWFPKAQISKFIESFAPMTPTRALPFDPKRSLRSPRYPQPNENNFSPSAFSISPTNENYIIKDPKYCTH
jgi:hypothetical protein